MYDKVRLINKLHLRKNLQNCNGYITTEDLREILTELDPDLSRFHLSFKSQHFENQTYVHVRVEVEGIVEEVDEDSSGTVDFDEFLAMMTGQIFV